MDPERVQRQALKRSLVGHFIKSANEEAKDLYWTAGNLYKSRGQLEQAAECFMCGVQLDRNSGNGDRYDYALESGEIYLKSGENKKAIHALEIAVEIGVSTASVKPALAMKLLGQAYRNVGDIEKAADAITQAYSLYDAEGNSRMAAKSMLQVGELYARKATGPEMYLKAFASYDIAVGYIKSQGFQTSHNTAIKQVFCAALASIPPRKYNGVLTLDPQSQQFIERIQFEIKSNNEESFTDTLYGWDQIHKLDDTAIVLSLKMKQMFDLNELL